MQVRKFTTQQTVGFSGSHYNRHLGVVLAGDSHLILEAKIGDDWQLVDTVIYSGTYPLFASTNLVRFTPVGDITYELPLDTGELR